VKVNNPTEWYKKPIAIQSKEQYDKVISQLDKIGFKWNSGLKLCTLDMSDTKNLHLYCYSNKTVCYYDELEEHNYHL